MGAPTTHREIEYKLRVHGLFRLPPLAGVSWGAASVEPQPSFTMRNTYYDTGDLTLFRWRVTLRRREGGPDEGWHLKLPVEGAFSGARDELRLPLTPGSNEVPEALAGVVSAFLRGRTLVPVVTLSSERTPALLKDEAGNPTAELVDDTVTVLDGDRIVAVFREIEVEGIPGSDGEVDEAVLIDVVTALINVGAEPSSVSKAAAALGPRTQEPCDLPEPTWPGPQEPAGKAVHAYLATHVRQMLLQDVRLRRGLPDAVHQLRVSARRLRSGLRVFRPLVDREWADQLRGELAWAATNLGTARDTEVLIDRVDQHCDLLQTDDARLVRDFALDQLEQELVNSQDQALATMNTLRYQALLEALVQAVDNPPFTALADEPARSALKPLVGKAVKHFTKKADRLDLDSDASDWHDARIAAKRARYATEAIAPVLDHGLGRLAKRLADATDVLGTHQDAFVAQNALRRLASGADGPTAFALGLLHGIEAAAEYADRECFAEVVWPTVRKAAKRAGV